MTGTHFLIPALVMQLHASACRKRRNAGEWRKSSKGWRSCSSRKKNPSAGARSVRERNAAVEEERGQVVDSKDKEELRRLA